MLSGDSEWSVGVRGIVRAGGSHYINMIAVDGKEGCLSCSLVVARCL